MKFGITITVGALLSCALASKAIAQPVPCQTCQSPDCGCEGHPPGCCCEGLCEQTPPNLLAPGRPSPPPCCADGICYPNCTTWGHYATRWRRWPIEHIELAPSVLGVLPARPLGPDVPPFALPPIEEEDRRAPPPSAPRVQPGEAEVGTPPAPAPGERPEETTSPAPAEPSGGPVGLPSPESLFGPEESPGVAPLVPSPSEGETPPTAVPLDEPMGGLDPPPAPTFKAPVLNNRPTVRSAGRPATPAPKSNNRPAPQDDPPPAMPIAMANWSN
ncbi:MAG: hypothetical protein L0228_05075 [Planctomycetes bacterium]|nr:hypothetical protein [Planctomycetota bacterium]